MPSMYYFWLCCILPFGELDEPLKDFVPIEFDQIKNTNVNSLVKFSFQISIFKYTMKGFNKHICVNAFTDTVTVTPVFKVV
jgi:hypothetical protein